MTEQEIHTGGCSCGAVRYERHGKPTRVAVYHCRYCQTRTGSAFGMNVYFEDSQIKVTSGELKEYSLSNNANRHFHNLFCPNCGTTVFCKVDISFSVSHETAAYYSPTQNDQPNLMILEEQPLQSFDLLHH